MKLLLDENIDKRLKTFFDADFDIKTVPERGWQGIKNGTLLELAAREFDVFITMDKNLEHQQSLANLDMAVIVIRAHSNAFPVVSQIMPQVNQTVREARVGTITHVKQSL